MIYQSKATKTYFSVPEDTPLKTGSFPIYTLDDKKFLVNEAFIQTYKITQKEANKYLYKELGQSINQFMDNVKSKLEDTKEKKENPPNFLETDRLSEKAKEGVSFLKDMKDVIKVVWDTAKNKEQPSEIETKEKMREIRKSLEAKGIPIGEDFEKIPLEIWEKHSKEEGENSFHESAAKFEEELAKAKKTFGDLFKNKPPT